VTIYGPAPRPGAVTIYGPALRPGAVTTDRLALRPGAVTTDRLALPVTAAILAAVLAAAGWLAVHPAAPAPARWLAPVAAAPVGAPANPFRTVAAAGRPTRLRIPAISVDTAMEQLVLDRAGRLAPPTRFGDAGWYAAGTAPGDLGPAVIAGHVDSTKGPAVFYRLRELTPGDRVEVLRGGHPLRFTVVSSAWYAKDAFPTARVYGPTPDRELRLITCGGTWNRSLRSYRDDLVVYAVAG
jgi:hypothetical protein